MFISPSSIVVVVVVVLVVYLSLVNLVDALARPQTDRSPTFALCRLMSFTAGQKNATCKATTCTDVGFLQARRQDPYPGELRCWREFETVSTGPTPLELGLVSGFCICNFGLRRSFP